VTRLSRETARPHGHYRPSSAKWHFGCTRFALEDVQGTLCGAINNQHPKKSTEPSSKDARIQDLQNSIRECNSAFSELSAENMNKPVQTPTGQLTHLAALLYVITHASEEYGELALTLRLNHLAPPTSDEPKHVT
jgi:hypothetical protein